MFRFGVGVGFFVWVFFRVVFVWGFFWVFFWLSSPGKGKVLDRVEIRKWGLTDKDTGNRFLVEAFKPVTSLPTLPFSFARS